MDEADYYREFEKRGERGVRDDLATDRYGEPDGQKIRLAKEWLRQKNQWRSTALEARNEASNLEQIRIARSAKNAAWAAAIAAIIAAICAIIAIAVSFQGGRI